MSTNTPAGLAGDVKDVGLAEIGKRRTEWAFQSMPVLQTIRKYFIKTQPFAGIRIAACLHVTTETANLMISLRDGGASVALCASNPLSTQDDTAATLVKDYGIPVYAKKGEDAALHDQHMQAVADHRPHVTLDNGCELLNLLHARKELLDTVLCGTEETFIGVAKLRGMARSKSLRYPVIAANEAKSQHLFDNQYGTGQSVVDGILRATNLLIAGLTVVVAGFGWCGRGIAHRVRGMGANVIVTEVDPLKAVEAVMDGFRVMSMSEAAALGDIVVTVTGSKHVIHREHFDKLKNNVILANAGHFNVEIDLETLGNLASSRRQTREFVEEYAMRDGRRIYVLGEGRLINLASAEGHPASVMDIAFASQALSVEYLMKNHATLEKNVFPVPPDIDRQVAKMKLEAMGVKIDRLTLEQEHYLSSCSEGV